MKIVKAAEVPYNENEVQPSKVDENKVEEEKTKNQEIDTGEIKNEEKVDKNVEKADENPEDNALDNEADIKQNLPTEENLANEPPVMTSNAMERANIAGTLDWTLISKTYRVNIEGSTVETLGEGEGAWFKLNGESVFCVEAKVQAYKEEGYEIDTTFLSVQQRHDISLITYFGFTTQAKDEIHYMSTQIMIWQYLGEGITFLSPAWETQYYQIKNDINNSINKFKGNASFNKETITLHGIGEDYAVTLTDTNSYFKDSFYSSTTNNGLQTQQSDNTLKIWSNSYFQDKGMISYQAVQDGYIGESIIYKGTTGSQKVINAKNVWDPGYTFINVEIDIHAPIKITKKDADTGKVIKVAGTVYDIYKSDGTYVTSTTSDASGVATSSDLEYGNYYYLEKTAPTAFQVNKTPVNFSIEVDKSIAGHEFVSSEISDKRVTAKSTLTKLDAITGSVAQGDARLDGAIYGFYAAENIMDPSNDGSILYTKDQEISRGAITNGQVSATANALGKFYWKEITPSYGYLIDPEKRPVTFTYTNQELAVEVRDTTSYEQVKKQAVRIVKLSTPGISGEAPVLKGAEFTIKLVSEVNRVGWDAARTYDVLVTDEKGESTSKELPFGRYIAKETKVPANHEPVGDITFVIDKDSRDPQVWRYFIDEIFQSKLAVVKTDSETGNTVALAGMKFKIKCLTGNADFATGEYVGYWAWNPLPHFVNSWETTEDGAVFLEQNLKPATYQIEELEGPEGYLLNQEPLQFEIKKGGWHQQTGPDGSTIVTTVQFSDRAVKGQVKLDKQADLFKGYDFRATEYGNLYEPIYERGMLPNVKFEIKAKTDILGADGTLWYKAGESVTTMTSDGINITTSSLLPLGIENNNLYTLQEIETEEGYVLDPTIYTFKFDSVDDETPVVYPTWLDEDGDELDTDDIFVIDNDKQASLGVANKQMEESDINDSSQAYQDVTYGVFADQVSQLDQDSLVGVSQIDEQGDMDFSLTQAGNYYLQELSTNSQYNLDSSKYPFNYAYNGDKIQTIQLNDGEAIYNYLQRGSVAILKTDKESSKPLVNVLYELATDEKFENIIKTTATGENGKAIFEELEKGTYFIREKYDDVHDMVVEGYVKDPTVHKVVIDENEQVIELTLNNQPVKGQVRFTKTGESFNTVEIVEGAYGTEYHPVWTQGSLLGSYLTIEATEDITTWDGTQWYKKGDIVAELESDWDTVDSLLLPVGNYVAYESKAGHGYILSDTRYPFEITKNGSAEIQLNDITINNQRAKVNIDFTKTLENQETFVNPDAYQDVVFGLYARENIYDYMGNVLIPFGSLIGTSHIDESGNLLETYDLPNGTYFFKELQTNEQYNLSDEEYHFEIGYRGDKTEEYTIEINDGEAIENTLIRGTIEVIKTSNDKAFYSPEEQVFVDSLSRKDPNQLRDPLLEEAITYLTGVPFELATDKEFKNIIQHGVTDLDGRLVFDELERGTYFVREEKSLDYYVMDPTIHEITIERNAQFETIDVDNNLIESYVDIKKVDFYDQSKTLPFAGFTMYSDKECTQAIRTIQTDTSGIAHFDGIKFGTTVYLMETSAPAGYELSDQVIEVTIDADWINGGKDTHIIVFPNQPLPVIQVVTGDSSQTMYVVSLFILSAGCISLLFKRRKK